MCTFATKCVNLRQIPTDWLLAGFATGESGTMPYEFGATGVAGSRLEINQGGSMMSRDSQERSSSFEVASVAIGVRFGPRWVVVDRLGDVLDKVLRSGPFSSKFFPNAAVEGSTRLLMNPKTRDSLSLNERDCILQVDVGSRDTSKIRVLAENFDRFILDPMKAAGLDEIARFGLMIRLAECSQQLSTKPADVYLASEEGTPRSLDLLFTRRLQSPLARAKRDVNDYRNLIYAVKQTEGEVHFGIDYQEYFDPPLDRKSADQKPIASFVDDGLNYFLTSFHRWLERFTSRQAA